MRRARVITSAKYIFAQDLPIPTVFWPHTSIHLLFTFGGSVLWEVSASCSSPCFFPVLLNRLASRSAPSTWSAVTCLSLWHIPQFGVKVQSFAVWLDDETQRKQMWRRASKSRRSEYGLLLSSRQTRKGWGLSWRKHHLSGLWTDFTFSGLPGVLTAVLAVDMPWKLSDSSQLSSFR